MKNILVLGSLNADLVQRVVRIPVPGETLQGSDLEIFAGGKGANQACAAGLAGGFVRMAGKVGGDAFGDRLMSELQRAGVGTKQVERSSAPTGTATIFVLPNGENTIVISSGANADVSSEFALEAIEELASGDLLLCQLETPLKTVTAALQAANAKGVVTMLDPAPARELEDEVLKAVDILTPNQTEAATLLGWSETPRTFAEAERAARKLQIRGARTVIVKMGEQGCLIAAENKVTVSPGFAVKAVDTTAAGDTFNGALAASLARGEQLESAVRFANAAAALSVSKRGAIPSMPRRDEIESWLAAHG